MNPGIALNFFLVILLCTGHIVSRLSDCAFGLMRNLTSWSVNLASLRALMDCDLFAIFDLRKDGQMLIATSPNNKVAYRLLASIMRLFRINAWKRVGSSLFVKFVASFSLLLFANGFACKIFERSSACCCFDFFHNVVLNETRHRDYIKLARVPFATQHWWGLEIFKRTSMDFVTLPCHAAVQGSWRSTAMLFTLLAMRRLLSHSLIH